MQLLSSKFRYVPQDEDNELGWLIAQLFTRTLFAAFIIDEMDFDM